MELSRRDLLRLGLAAGAGLSLGIRTAAGEEPSKPTPAPDYLAAAVRAARWIHTARVETPDGLLWLTGPERPEGLDTAPNLYSGSAGVVLFLLELARATGDKAHREEAAAGADALIAGLPEEIRIDRAENGLYTGVAGIGFTLFRVYQETGNDVYRKGALRCRDLIHAAAKPAGAGRSVGRGHGHHRGLGRHRALPPLHGAQHGRPGLPRAGGEGGAAPRRAGNPDGGGRKWRMDPTFERLMPNFSHGTAGIAYFLATLHRETGRQEFLDAALAGARYLQSVANTTGDSCLIFHKPSRTARTSTTSAGATAPWAPPASSSSSTRSIPRPAGSAGRAGGRRASSRAASRRS